jgi:hypothetical protein
MVTLKADHGNDGANRARRRDERATVQPNGWDHASVDTLAHFKNAILGMRRPDRRVAETVQRQPR